jgi:hypothetical protein
MKALQPTLGFVQGRPDGILLGLSSRLDEYKCPAQLVPFFAGAAIRQRWT